MENTINCLYCTESVKNDNSLECIQCKNWVHLNCLKRPGTPGDLFGDVFFKFTCCNCGEDKKEQFIRTPIPWTIIIILTIYNLSINSKGLSLQGYFHWQTHITYFIEKNWNYIMGQNVQTRRKKQLNGIISGALSHHSHKLFESAVESLGSSGTGWWKLVHNQTPYWHMKMYRQFREEKRKDEDVDVCSDQVESIQVNNSKRIKTIYESENVFSRTIPYMGRPPRHLAQESSTNANRPPDELVDFLDFNNDMINDFTNMNPRELEDRALPLPSSNNSDWLDFLTVSPNKIETESMDFQPRIVQVTNFQEIESENVGLSSTSKVLLPNIKTESKSEDEQNYENKFTCKESLFPSSTIKRAHPWEHVADSHCVIDDYMNDENENIHLMTEYDENILLHKLKLIIQFKDRHNVTVPSWVRRFYRKLCLREVKKLYNLPIFDIDVVKYQMNRIVEGPQILDRFYNLIISSNCNSTTSTKISFNATLIGATENDLFESPYTGRILHPYIYRNTKCLPQWIKLMCELQYTVNKCPPTRAPIDFCYLRPHHISAVNSLLQKSFWHGIDMSECLTYPDFTVVALYKKLIVGCAFLVPDVGHNEAYISFMAVRNEWQRAGIATFMLYHLIQTCISRDITLHVSATNPAIFLYQKFGFKIEGFILDFYDKYLPLNSKFSRHAFFLRMKR